MAGNDILSRIQILLDADTARFEQGMQDAQDTSESSFKKIRESANKMGLMVGSAALAGTSALIAMSEAQAEQAKQIEIAAYKSQASTTEIQKYGVAAKQVGLETDQLADIYKDFNEKIGEFVTVGGGGAADFFEQVALKTEGSAAGAMKLAKQMAALSGPEAMGLYVKKMEEANLSQDQQNFLMESTASESQMLLPLYKNNAEQIKLWGDAAERTGVILDEYGIKKAAEYRVQSELLKMQMEGMKTQLVQAVIPAFVDIADAFQTGDKQARAMADGGEVLANVLRGVAAIGVGVYATVNLIANSLAGLSATAVTAIKTANATAEAENAKWYDKLPAVKMFKSALMITADVKSDNGFTADMMDQNARIVEQSAEMINKMFDNTVSAATAKMANIYGESEEAQAAATKGRQDWIDKQNEAAKTAKSTEKAQSDLNNKLEEQRRIQDSLIYEFSSASQKMYIDYVQQISGIQEANFNPSDRGQFLAAAKARYDDEILLYKMQQDYELREHKLNEEAKAHATYLIDQQIIDNRTDINRDEKIKYLASLDEKYNHQKRLLNLESNQRLNDASQAFQTDMQNMAAKYEFERQQIILNKSLNNDERTALINASRITENKEFFSSRDSAWDSYQNAIGVDTSLEQAASQRAEAIRAAYEWELITQEEYQQKMLESQQKYEAAKLQTTLSSGADILGSLTSIAKNVAGENSSFYAAMFAMEKGMAVARSMMAIQVALAQASANPFPMNLAAMATVAMQTANIVATIQGVQAPTGMAHDGIDYVPKEGTWLLEKGERVLSPRQNADFTRAMNERQSNAKAEPVQQPQVNVRVMNSWDESEFFDAMATPTGEKIVMNIIKRNRTKLRI
ncbi:hypothetical protein [Acinetobacter parvus]|uniref:hypothetical protein n=1 Tax=Acinetobacter parvus TaxID=134533 RepID=UPI003919EA26